ncbi:hypothetical protein H7F30_06845 [Dermacoccus sp. PAMC28757]|uniref:hypothetical protein n=1 Tax=Dermacoccus TaxID=57495 RepID=UPI00164DC7FC|nr:MULTISPECIES: hypothetical protein [Dermacoccus]QNK53973.1 hypothetical protein H7F30_06845 [Dermacoccus sp. PAMC28757]
MPTERVTEHVSRRLALHAWSATAVVAVGGLLFVLIAPGVGDMWAALARAQAARDGVTLGYWFSWYSGAHPPGGYSVIVPWLSALLGAHLVVALAALAIPWAVALTVTQVRRPIVAVWVATISALLTLGAGRTTFLVGAVIAIGALDAAIRDRRWLASFLVVLSGLASPVAVAFVLVGLGAGFLGKRLSIVPILAGLAFLGVSSWLWGSSGPEGYGWARALISLALLAVFLFANPARPVKVAIVIATFAIVVFSAVPNAMGSNLARLVFAVLPVAVAATARRSNRFTALAVVPALVWSAYFTAHDLADSRASASSVTVYQPLADALKRQPGIETSRVEVVADGTHTSAFVLAKDFWLARGYETQADRSLSDAFVDREASISPEHLNGWLRDSSVRYVALNRHPVKRTGEWRTANAQPEGWREVWSNRDWRLFEVSGTKPLIGDGATLRGKSASHLVLNVQPGRDVVVRVRWSSYLHSRIVEEKGPGDASGHPDETPRVILEPSGDGWTMLRLEGSSVARDVELFGRP